MISSKNRFHGHNSLSYVYRHGQAVYSRFLNIKYISNKNRRTTRFAVIVSKKIHKRAVKRNRLRRQIYEYLRLKTPEIKDVYDIVVIVTTNEIHGLNYQELKDQLNQLFEQAEIAKS